ncbi:hypothetical protein M5X00_11355 [Paenibacillus alvei]|uniref:hypothetical protein n=1 Tax=Paenibacillus alvei TaxID=44250 RepID=UPI000287B1B0|nr:hypothetical protein [Paenibacillus alvei]EJW16164.1 hypothetical protein PAV_6c02450 [Paenibacillus alvei DSM 29]MCY9543431.1 hypothetical protein [Paenibacillus alvei]MCY9704499.1 hypothetical protein [Paenibacillus alvei]MCY9732841.1 hypothetical protein [Paenibacillus alvei]MCY9754840.1 hypothetical protein [Paenibacillus alvei]
MKKILSILAAATMLAGVLTIQAPQAQAASGTYLGTYDLRGDGTMQMVYRNGTLSTAGEGLVPIHSAIQYGLSGP